ncbi:hypothetical protein [Actinocorallia herbida]|uniref:hypothetical protein n=1 Tax=Actinocorallia herbida TaxID=58109 RepID=UPI0011CED042|nr:hypothetical protein [Actinocorallia herbida]
MAWGPGEQRRDDPFGAAEQAVRDVVGASWWPSARPGQREHALAGQVVELPDGTQWLFGAWARWYRKHPGDTQWYLCPPPYAAHVRGSGKQAQPGSPPPPHVVPIGPDFTARAAAVLPPFGADLGALTGRVRATLESAATLNAQDHPLPENPARWIADFLPTVPSTVAACWGTVLWCAAAPVFDAREDAKLLGLWEPYRTAPLPRIDGPRWLTPPTLAELASLYVERLRAHRVEAAVVVLRTMWATASVLREEPRFAARAEALLAILGSTLADPQVDYGALPHGDVAVAQLWITRCPPHLTSALRVESSPGDGFRHAFYDFAQTLVAAAGEPGGAAFVEPRLIAAALLAADLSVVRQDVVQEVSRWLDPELRFTVQAMVAQAGHPLRRRFWPEANRLPEPLRAGTAAQREEVLAALCALDLAWCRLGGGIPARPRGFPAAIAVLAELVGVERATATTPAPPPQAWGAQPSAGTGQRPQPQDAPAQAGWSPQGPGQDAPGQAGWNPQQGQAQDAAAQAAWSPQQGQPQDAPAQGGWNPRQSQQQPQPGAPWGAQQPAGAGTPWSPQAGGPEGTPQGGPAQGQQNAPWGPQGDQGAAGPQDQAAALDQQAQPAEPGVRRPGAAQRGPTAEELAQNAGKVFEKAWGRARRLGGRLLGGGEPGPQPDAYSTGPIGFDRPDGPSQPPVPTPQAESRPTPAAPVHGTQVMSETMVGDFLDYAPVPARPVRDIAPPPEGPPEAATVTRRGVTFVHDPRDDAAAFLDALPAPVFAADSTQVYRAPTPDSPLTMLDQDVAGLLREARGPQPGPAEPPRTMVAPPGAFGPAAQPGPASAQPGEPPRTMVAPPGAFGPAAAEPAEPPRTMVAPPGALGLDDGSDPTVPDGQGDGSGFDPAATMLDRGGPRRPAGEPADAQASGPDRAGEGRGGDAGFDPQATMLDQGGPRRPAGTPADAPTSMDQGGPRRPAEAPFDAQATMLDQGGARRPAGDSGEPPATMLDRPARGGGAAFDPNATMFDPGRPADPQATVFDAGAGAATRFDGGPGPAATRMEPAYTGPVAVSVLLVGTPHTGQRRLARMISGIVSDGALVVRDAEDLRGLALERLATLFDPGGSAVLLERLDVALLDANDPAVFLRTLRTVRARARTPLIATCDPRSYRRIAEEHPELARVFRVYKLPELRDIEERTTLLRVLADERRASLDTVAWAAVREDLVRLRGPGDLTGARLVETYLERAYNRALGRGGGARERLVLEAADFSGVAESIEPALHPGGDVDGYLDLLADMIGLETAKAEIERLAREAEAPVNLIFEGPPGTGKATVAGLLAGIFGALGVLPSGHLIQCRPEHIVGRDTLETELRTAGIVRQAEGGVLLVQKADGLTPEAVAELFRGLREHPYMLVLAATDIDPFLTANPDIAATFERVDFTPPSDRELVQLFVKLAEKKLYMVDEELRLELMTRFARFRDSEQFAFGRTVHTWFDDTVARQARRISGLTGADALTVARLTTRDLPESGLERMLGDLQQTRRPEGD